MPWKECHVEDERVAALTRAMRSHSWHLSERRRIPHQTTSAWRHRRVQPCRHFARQNDDIMRLAGTGICRSQALCPNDRAPCADDHTVGQDTSFPSISAKHWAAVSPRYTVNQRSVCRKYARPKRLQACVQAR